MEKGDTENAGRLRDWIILIFVLVVMGLLIADLGSNALQTWERDRGPAADDAAVSPAAD